MKNMMRDVGKTSSSGGKGKEEQVNRYSLFHILTTPAGFYFAVISLSV